MTEILNFEAKDDKTFYFFNIDNIITTDYKIVIENQYVVVLIENSKLIPIWAILKDITTELNEIAFKFSHEDGSDDLIIRTNIFSDEKRNWYILDEQNYFQFKKMHHSLSNFISGSKQ